MVAGITAARRGLNVCLLEHKNEVGKKILNTGNGKCNLTHVGVCPKDYPDEYGEITAKVFEQFGYEKTLDFFKSIGIFTTERNGYVYPMSGTALSVRNALSDELKRLNADVFIEVHQRSRYNTMERLDIRDLPEHSHIIRGFIKVRSNIFYIIERDILAAVQRVVDHKLIVAIGITACRPHIHRAVGRDKQAQRDHCHTEEPFAFLSVTKIDDECQYQTADRRNDEYPKALGRFCDADF